jgi:hypothetical protein
MKGQTVELPIFSRPATVGGRVQITRSFSYKLNVGNYESREFFCSQKAWCDALDADRISEALYHFCKKQTMTAVRDYLSDNHSANHPNPIERKTA